MANYTSGITKVVFMTSARDLADAMNSAEVLRVDCFTFNGLIYQRVVQPDGVHHWVKSTFELTDFQF